MLNKKFFAVFLSLTVLLIAAPLSSRSETPELAANTSLALSNLAVPDDIGKVQERFTGSSSLQAGSSPRTIIQIQDVHAHAVAQQNIAAILERIRTVFGIEKVALEGAWSSTSLPNSHGIATSREKQLLAETLLDDDRISGPVSAAIMSPEPITLIGIEDEAAYEKNRALFLTHLARSEEILEKLQIYGASLQESQRSSWKPALSAFANNVGKFRENSDLGKFLPFLLESAKALEVDSSLLTQVLLFRDIMVLEKGLEKDRLEAEVRQVIKKHKDSPWTLEELIRGGKIPPEEIGLYPEIKKLVRLYQMRDEISLRELMGQIGTLTGLVLEKLVTTPEEDALWKTTERFYLSKKILLLQATPEDMRAYADEKSQLETELAKAGLSEPLALSVAFYEAVKHRDEIFFNKIMNDPALAGNIAIVTGGFHTDGLSQKFRDAGISYITITPELGNTSMNEKLYNARMAEGGERMEKSSNPEAPSSILHPPSEIQTLSELRNAIAWIDDRFPRSYQALLQTKDVRKAVKVFLGETVPVSTSEGVSHLSAEGLLRKNSGAGQAEIPSVSDQEFLAFPRMEQLNIFRKWVVAAKGVRHRSMLVSSVGVLRGMLAAGRAEARIKAIGARNDLLILLQDVPATETPEPLMGHGIERFQATDMDALLQKTPSFLNLARQRPFVIMKNGYWSKNRAVVDEDPVWLELFPVLTLNARLYESARNAEFLTLLKTLWTETLSQELSGKAA